MNDIDTPKESWHSTAVSWGHFIIALTVTVVGMVTAILSDRLAIDRRLTILEERQHYSSLIESKEAMEYVQSRAVIETKLMEIQRQLTLLTIELSKHEAGTREFKR